MVSRLPFNPKTAAVIEMPGGVIMAKRLLEMVRMLPHDPNPLPREF
jgi:hypothetical protein